MEDTLQRAHSLHHVTEKDVDSKLAIDYSRMKFGDSACISKFSSGLAKLVQQFFRGRAVPHGQPVLAHIPTIVPQSGIHAVTLSLGMTLSLDVIKLTKAAHTFNYQLSSSSQRLTRTNSLFLAEDAAVGGKEVVLLDDCTVTGSILLSASTMLKKRGARLVSGFTILDIQCVDPEVESLFDLALYRLLGIEETTRVLNDPRNCLTGYSVTFLAGLSDKDRASTIALLREQVRRQIGNWVRSFPRSSPLSQIGLERL